MHACMHTHTHIYTHTCIVILLLNFLVSNSDYKALEIFFLYLLFYAMIRDLGLQGLGF